MKRGKIDLKDVLFARRREKEIGGKKTAQLEPKIRRQINNETRPINISRKTL